MQTTIQNDTQVDIQESQQALKKHTARADCFALVQVLLQVPNSELCNGLAQSLILCDVRAICEELDIDSSSVNEVSTLFENLQATLKKSDDHVSVLRREYTRLFSHPKKAVVPFYESLFNDAERVLAGKRSTMARHFVNPIAMAAERSYKEAGLSTGADLSIPADCITTELEFMGYLHMQAAQALIEGNEDKLTHSNNQRHDFWEQHVVSWMPRFFERCMEEDQVGLYAAVGALGKLLLSSEVEGLAQEPLS